MECPHLVESCKIKQDFVKSKRCQLMHRCNNDSAISTSSGQLTPNNSAMIASNGIQSIWKCLECSSKNTWMCLFCGAVLCGRYDSRHALQHFRSSSHPVAINTLDHSVYCYKCDNLVVNETRKVAALRQELKIDEDSYLESSSSSKSHQETNSYSSNDSSWNDVPIIGRRLRPRKRANSCDSSESSYKRKSSSIKKVKVVGLKNLGNTCFMNSVLQSLSNIKEFSCYFNALPCLEPSGRQKHQRVHHSRSLKENVSDANVVEELRKVLLNLSNGGDGSRAISPECLFVVIWKIVPSFRGHRQHDAHEFLRYMLDRLHTELQYISVEPPSFVFGNNSNGYGSGSACSSSSLDKSNNIGSCGGTYNNRNGRSSIVTNVFGGTLQSEVRCLVCGMESKKHDPFLDLSLDIPAKFHEDCADSNVSNGGNGVNDDDGSDGDDGGEATCNINDCLSYFTEVEELAETELYYCSSCKCKQKSTKRFRIRRLPNVLCLHIKRFRWNNFFRSKLDSPISFPIKSLDMSQYVLNNGSENRRNNSLSNHIYDLAAVIVHHGNGSSCGHYTSYAINNGTWLHFNDQSVKEVQLSTVAECNPYILFYIKKDLVCNSNNNF